MTVWAALAAGNARLPPSRARDAHLAALAAGARAVVTGQQVGLFLGPLYTIYKAASAIRLARTLDAVPLFWLQTEDHDLVEIAHLSCPGRTISVPASAEDRISIAHCTLPDAVGDALAELAEELRGHPHGEAHLQRLARHYRAGARWGDAFAGVMAELFAPEGLVFVDPRDPALAAAARPVHRRALRQAEAIADALLARTEALGEAAPVHVRPGAPLSYFHPTGPQGPRCRLQPSPETGRFREVGGGGEHAREAILAALDADPCCVSTSALLRPIVQDTLLRTAAYVGGPAEVAYYAQIEPLWPMFDLPLPRVVRRGSFRLIPGSAQRILSRFGLTPDDAARPEEELLGRDDTARLAADDLTRRLLGPYEQAQAGVEPAVLAADPHLRRELDRARYFVARSVDRLARKYRGALLRRDADRVEQIRRLKLILHPGAPQERTYGLPWFAARHGDREIVERVLALADPNDPRMKDVLLT